MKKVKLLVDIVMTICMVVLMGYQVTGNKWHEILGVGLFFVFFVHCILNWKWFANIGKIGKNAMHSLPLFLWMLTNILLFLDMISMAVTSVILSREVFSFLQLSVGGYFWKYLHVVNAYAGLIIISVHIGCHWKMILQSIKKAFHCSEVKKGITITGRVLALLLALLGIINSFRMDIGHRFIYRDMGNPNGKSDMEDPGQRPDGEDFSGNRQGKRPFDGRGKGDGNHFGRNEHFQENSDSSDQSDDVTQENQISESSEQEASADLSGVYCDGCGRQCSLANPQCGKGVQKAQEYLENNVQDSEEKTEEDSTQQSEDSTQQSEDNAQQSEDSTHQSEDNAQQSEDSTQQSEDNAQQSEEQSDRPELPEQGKEPQKMNVLTVFANYIPVMSLYICGTYYALEFIDKRRKKEMVDDKAEADGENSTEE